MRNTELMKERMKELMKELNDNDDIFSRNKLLLTNKESLTGAATIQWDDFAQKRAHESCNERAHESSLWQRQHIDIFSRKKLLSTNKDSLTGAAIIGQLCAIKSS